MLHLYSKYAKWWPLMSPVDDYREEAQTFAQIFRTNGVNERAKILELGSGGGNNAFYLKTHFDLTLVDLAPEMVSVSEKLNPECGHYVGDMTTWCEETGFDGVFVHDAICYLDTEASLSQLVENVSRLIKPGGVAVFAPDYFAETYNFDMECGGTQAEDAGFRYVAWGSPLSADYRYTVDYAYILTDADQVTSIDHERHYEAAFPKQIWFDVLSRYGFECMEVDLQVEDAHDGYAAIVGVRRQESA